MATRNYKALIKRSARRILGVLVLLLSLLNGTTAGAQVYATKNGTITLRGTYKGTAVMATSQQLHVRLYYNTSEVYIHLWTGSLKTSSDSLRELLLSSEFQDVIFAGTLKTGPLSTKPHAKQVIPIPGTLSLRGHAKPYTLAATLEHLSDGNTRCILSAELTIHLSDFGLATVPQENQLQVSLQQLVLKRPGEQ